MMSAALPLFIVSWLSSAYIPSDGRIDTSARERIEPRRAVPDGAVPAGSTRLELVTRSRDYFRTGPPRLRAIARAMELLPERPAAVQVFSLDEANAHLRRKVAQLDAFVARGSRTVYLTKHSPVLQRASGGSVFHTYVLAAIIWHEMAHLAGADEAGARRREEILWTRFLLDNHLDRNMALAYQRILRSRGPATPHLPLTTSGW